MLVVNCGWADIQPETRGIETALTASPRPLQRKLLLTTDLKEKKAKQCDRLTAIIELGHIPNMSSDEGPPDVGAECLPR